MIDGLTDPDAREILDAVAAEIDTALLTAPVQAGDASVQVHAGVMFHVLEGLRTVLPRAADRARTRNESPIRILGRDLIVDDADKGVWAPGRSYTVDGRAFGDETRITRPGIASAFGGFLFWRYDLTLSKLGTAEASVLQATAGTTVDLVHSTTALESALPTYTILEADPGPPAVAGDVLITDANGTLYQLCASYDAAGRVVIFQRLPRLLASGSKPWKHA